MVDAPIPQEMIERAARAMWLGEVMKSPASYRIRLKQVFSEQQSAEKWRKLALYALTAALRT